MKIFTIGHSTHSIEDFISLLKNNEIDTIVDIRSSPYSKYTSQFNREELSKHLMDIKMKYIFMGDLLGARYHDKNLLFEDGRVDFKKVQNSQSFLKGIERLEKGMLSNYTIALMCTEQDALECHRFALVSEYLIRNGVEVFHVMPDKVYSTSELEKKLIKKYNKKINHIELLLSGTSTVLEKSYELLNIDIAYIEKETNG